MASLRGYTTATKVRDVFAARVDGTFSDADIETIINRIEGVIDVKLRRAISSQTGGHTFTFSASTPAHMVIEGAATYGAALQLCGPSVLSWNSFDQLINAQNIFSFMFKLFMDEIESEGDSQFIVDE